ncbi:MAG TPA: energy transducer TonB [Pyrinomonadaceae bacterium]|jgi:TonB family protein
MSISVGKEYVPTIINSRSLLARLALELGSLKQDLRNAWPEFKKHPVESVVSIIRQEIERAGRVLFAPSFIAACAILVCLVAVALLFDRTRLGPKPPLNDENADIAIEIGIPNLSRQDKKPDDHSIGRGGKGRVGINQGLGEGSGEVRQSARGGGGSGDHNPLPAQIGKLLPPSTVLASIPKTPPLSPALPVAGMDLDPALWKDMKTPVFGDPRSSSTEPSKGPGDGGVIGSNNGLGIGDGNGPGFGPGNNGNTGNGDKRTGCCGGGAASGNAIWTDDRILTGRDVEQRARLLSKPEPQYTEEARRNQITGTVMLRVVFSSAGHVEQIHAVQTLPFGLTEKAIAAARQIRFVPATKAGHSVSVWMQLEYNFNLY